jgi:quinol monooxygenase YgiN
MPNDLPSPSSRRQIIAKGLSAGLGLLVYSPFISQAAQAKPSMGQTPSVPPPTVAIYLTAKAAATDALMAYLLQVLPTVRAAEGCRDAKIQVQADNPRQVMLLKTWDSLAAQEKYLAWEKATGRLEKLLALIEGEPRIEYWALETADLLHE